MTYLEQTKKRQQARVERSKAIVLNDQQRALAGQAISEIKGTPGFQVLLEILESLLTTCGSLAITELANLAPEEVPRRAGYWYGYESCAIHLLQEIDRLVEIKDRYEKQKTALDARLAAQIFRGADPTV